MGRVISYELELTGVHGMAVRHYPALLAAIAAGTLDPAAARRRDGPARPGGRELAAMSGFVGPRRDRDHELPVSDALELAVGGRVVRVTSPDKVYFPERGFTKADVVRYFLDVGDGILAAVRDRPTMLERWPGGMAGQAIFQRRIAGGVPDWVEAGPDGVYPTEPAVVAWAASLGTLRFHPSPVRRARPGHPDELRIDLDPQPGTGFREAVAVARELRGLLDAAGLAGRPQDHRRARAPRHRADRAALALAGGRGRAGGAGARARRADAAARDDRAAQARPRRARVRRPRPVPRRRRVLDPPVPRALVSAPLGWDELDAAEPEDFDVETVPGRLARLRDADGAARRVDRGAALMRLPVMPQVAPMLAKAVAEIPPGRLYEPKWDGFRSIVFRDGDEVEIGSRNERPMTRYFPELVAAVTREPAAALRGRRRDRRRERRPAHARLLGAAAADPSGGEPRGRGSPPRRRPRSSRSTCSRSATTTSRRGRSSSAARRSSACSRAAAPPVHLTPITRDGRVAQRWFEQFEGAGLDGVVAKRAEDRYQPGKRVMFKIKHVRTADCVLAGYRPHKSRPRGGRVAPARPLRRRRHAGVAMGGHVRRADVGRRRRRVPGRAAARAVRRAPAARLRARRAPVGRAGRDGRRPRAGSRWNPGKDLSFVPLRPERVLEVRYDHMEGARFRHPPQFVRWRPDRDPASCGYAQLEQPVRFACATCCGVVEMSLAARRPADRF